MRVRWTLALTATLSLSLLAGATRAQEFPTPSPELKKLDFLVGKFTGKGELMIPGMGEMEWTSTTETQMGLGGFFAVGKTEIQYGALFKEDSATFIGWDEASKSYRMHRFTSMDPSPSVAVGKLVGDKLVLESLKQPGDDSVFRVTFGKRAGGGCDFLLELKQGDAYQKLMEGAYLPAK